MDGDTALPVTAIRIGWATLPMPTSLSVAVCLTAAPSASPSQPSSAATRSRTSASSAGEPAFMCFLTAFSSYSLTGENRNRLCRAISSMVLQRPF